MVHLYKELFGRGPTKAKTDLIGDEAVLCTLEHSLTQAEKALVGLGEHQRLRDTRMYFQYATEQRFLEVIERATGRKVRAFISGLDAGKDVAAELFYLEPSEAE